ncbi:MAG: hypothetical protein JXQ65_04750 [Candidatus Marinimicrobia bacterium]|nr:hypothetical protein [Candidatus Neomarinimicrobiota bacterium]
MKNFIKIYLAITSCFLALKAASFLSDSCYIFYSDGPVHVPPDSGMAPFRATDFLFNDGSYVPGNYVHFLFSLAKEMPDDDTHDSLFIVLPSIRSGLHCSLNGKALNRFFYSSQPVYHIPHNLFKPTNFLIISHLPVDFNTALLSGPPILCTSGEMKNGINFQAPVQALPLSNGISNFRYHADSCYFSHFYPHLYQFFDENTRNLPVLKKIVPLLLKNRRPLNLKEIISSSQYIEGTGILQAQGMHDDTRLSLYAFCPFSENEALWIIYFLIEGQNSNEYIPDFLIKNPNKTLDTSKEIFSNSNQKWLRLILHYRGQTQFSLTKYKNLNDNFEILVQELSFWKNWQQSTLVPKTVNALEKSLYLQSLVMLKMAQVREPVPAKGQIVSGFPPVANRTNLLDQSLITEALLHGGHYPEAVQSLQFLMNSKCNKHRNVNFVGNNLGLLNNYALSVYNYYGKGEEMKLDDQNPVISLAGFGLTLSNIRLYIELTDDVQFLEYFWDKIYREIALVLINLIDNSDLIREDAGLFEKPLPGTHNTYTSAIIYKGLVDAAWMGRMLNQETAIQEFEFYANKIRLSIEKKLWDRDPQIVRACLEGRTKDKYIDASIFSLNNNIYTPQDEITLAVIKTLESQLSVNNLPLVYSQFKYNTLDREISFFCNLKFAENYFHMKDNLKGNSIVNLITESSRKNHFLIQEDYTPLLNTSLGDVSIRTHGAFVKTLHQRK